jgi:3-oxoacyl-[acyl-carrier-protein] synthase III
MVNSLFNLGSTYLKTKFENTFQFQKNDSQIYPTNNKNLPLKIVGMGMYVPPKVETAAEVAIRINRSEDWVISNAGVKYRHVAEEAMEVMAAKAARQALGDVPPDLIINASLTPRQLIPDTSVFIQRELGLTGIPSFSIHATCLSFLVALHTSANLLASGAYRRILIVSSEAGTICRNFNEPESAALIGDGAAAAVLEASSDGESSQILGWKMITFPEGAELTEIRGCGLLNHPNCANTRPEDNLFYMNGPGVYKLAMRKLIATLNQLFEQVGIRREDIDLVIPHQASGRGLMLVPRLGFPEDRIINIVSDYGNCIAASIPMALAHAQATERLRRGDRVLLLGTGAGLSIAAAIIQW